VASTSSSNDFSTLSNGGSAGSGSGLGSFFFLVVDLNNGTNAGALRLGGGEYPDNSDNVDACKSSAEYLLLLLSSESFADDCDGGRNILVCGFIDGVELSDPEEEAEDMDGGRNIFVKGLTDDLSDPEDADAGEVDGGRKISVYGFTEDLSSDLSEPDEDAEEIEGGRKIFVYGFTEDWSDLSDLSEPEDEAEDIDGGRKIFVYGLTED
jgi:hypothetical protein